MSFLLSYLTRICRRKSAIIGSVLVLVLLLSLLMSGDRKINIDQPYSEELIGFHKKLQQTDETFESVKFIPGVPGTHPRQIPKVPPNHSGLSDEGNIEKVLYESGAGNKLNFKPESMVKSHGNGHQGPAPYQDENLEHEEINQQVVSGERVGKSVHSRLEVIESLPPFIPEQRLVHLCFTGAPTTIPYLKKVVNLSRQLGATGVLIEWEDMFPWTDSLGLTAATNHYSHSEVIDLINYCEGLGLEVIPLVQTFGHLEFILKHEEFAYLRDVAEMPESICPCHNDTMDIVKMIIDQVMAVHKRARYLHIGCDEVYHLGECEECQGTGRTSVFVDHVTRVAEYVKSKYHKVQPIIWDDMMRNMMQEEMQPLSKLVEPMVWVYAEDVYRFVPSWTWDRYSEVFDWIWTASAFKGAHGETLVVPDISKHLNNNVNWLTLMSEQKTKMKGGFRGIVLTGWQRYDHFAVLCELLPSGIPSLALNLIVTSHGYYNNSLVKPFLTGLSCSENIGHYNNYLDLENDKFLWNRMTWCFFPGSKVFKLTKDLVMLETDFSEYMRKVEVKKGWLTDYNIRHNMSSPFRINEILEDYSRYQHEVVGLMKTANDVLSEMFDHYTVAEWIEQKIYPMYSKLSKLRSESDLVKQVKHWPSRPYPPLEALKGLGIGVPVTEPPDPLVPVAPEEDDRRPRRRVQAPDYYSSRRKHR